MDDFSPVPSAPSLDVLEPEQIDEQLLASDQKMARSYFHPAWEGVEESFIQKIEAMRIGCTDPKLPADEYKIEDMANKRVAVMLMEILTEVKNAVRVTEKRDPEGRG